MQSVRVTKDLCRECEMCGGMLGPVSAEEVFRHARSSLLSPLPPRSGRRDLINAMCQPCSMPHHPCSFLPPSPLAQNLSGVKNHLFFPDPYRSSNAFFTVFFASSLWLTSVNVSFVTTPFKPSSSSVYRVGMMWL